MEGNCDTRVATAFFISVALIYALMRKKPVNPKNDKVVARVSELTIYPVKGLQGISLPRAKISKYGFMHDRDYLIVEDTDEKLFVTQRKYPKMALIHVSLMGNKNLDEQGDTILTFTRPAMIHPLSVTQGKQDGRQYNVSVWGGTYPAIDQGDEAVKWFSDFLGKAVRLVRRTNEFPREVSGPWRVDGAVNYVSFTDGFPFLLGSPKSLESLNHHLPTPIPMDRFRPNILVDAETLEPFAEDRWDQVKIGENHFHIPKPCDRCAVTTVDQQQGKFAGTEPLTTLRKIRGSVNSGDIKCYFCENLIHAAASGTIRVRDEVEVTKFRTKPHPLFQQGIDAKTFTLTPKS